MTTSTMTSTTSAPAILKLIRLETEVATCSLGYDGEYTDRYLCDETKLELEEALCYADGEEEAEKIKKSFLSKVDGNYEVFSSTLNTEDPDSMFGTERACTKDAEAILTFAAAHAGQTLAQLDLGVKYEGGLVSTNTVYLLEELWDEEQLDYIEGQQEAVIDSKNRYVLQADATFKLAA